MLEVLAMLAIAGIIGSAGVGGYTVAMKKHRANELIHEAAGRALAVSQQLAVGRKLDEIDFGGYPNNDTGHGKFSDKPIPLAGGEFFKIPITGMDQAGCEQLKVMAGGSLRRVDCKDDGNGKVTADLIYQKDLSESVGTIPEDTSGDSENPSTSGTGNSATRTYDNDRSGCEENGYQYCSNNICITKEEVCETGSALCADTYPGTSEDNTGGYAGEVEGKTCRCPSQQAFNQNDKKCIPACSGHGTLNENEDCVCQGGYCGVVCENQITCQHGTWTPDKCECDANWYGPLCDSDCDGFRSNNGTCYSCSYFDGVGNTSKDECDKCSNREMISYLYYSVKNNLYTEMTATACGLKKCPEGTVRMSSSCLSCEKTLRVLFKTKPTSSDIEACNTCGGWIDSNPSYPECNPCSEKNYKVSTKEQCDLCTNRIYHHGYCALLPSTSCDGNDKFRAFLNGNCVSCSTSDAPLATVDECDKCSNTSYPRLTGSDGKCYSCSESYARSVTKDECDKCSNREVVGNYCVLTSASCNAFYPEGGFRTNSGLCYSCSDAAAPSTSKNECDKCGTQRTYDASTGKCNKKA